MSPLDNLPGHAPSRTVRPGDAPNPAAACELLAREGVETTDLDALGRFLAEQGWGWHLAGGHASPRSWAATVAPWISHDPWAESRGDRPAEAFSIAVTLTSQTLPQEMGDEGNVEIEKAGGTKPPVPARG